MTDDKHMQSLRVVADLLRSLGYHQVANEVSAAAERIRVLGEECEAWRNWNKCVVRYVSAEVMDVGARVERLEKAVDATDAARGGSR